MGWLSRRIAQGVKEGVESIDWADVGKQITDNINIDDIVEKIKNSEKAGAFTGDLIKGAGTVIIAQIREAAPEVGKAAMQGVVGGPGAMQTGVPFLDLIFGSMGGGRMPGGQQTALKSGDLKF